MKKINEMELTNVSGGIYDKKSLALSEINSLSFESNKLSLSSGLAVGLAELSDRVKCPSPLEIY